MMAIIEGRAVTQCDLVMREVRFVFVNRLVNRMGKIVIQMILVLIRMSTIALLLRDRVVCLTILLLLLHHLVSSWKHTEPFLLVFVIIISGVLRYVRYVSGVRILLA